MPNEDQRAWVGKILGVNHPSLLKNGGSSGSGIAELGGEPVGTRGPAVVGSEPSRPGGSHPSRGAAPMPSLAGKNQGELAKNGPTGSGPVRSPLNVRTIRIQFRVPASYDELRGLVETRFARELMSRTEVRLPDGSTGPVHRERDLVAESNLRQLHTMMRPGENLEITARMIPGAGGNRYERLVFALPPGYVAGGDVEPNISGRNGLRGLAGPDYEPPHPPPHRDDTWRRAQQILEARLGGSIVGGGPDLMWTPTATGISHVMPAVPGPVGFGPGGDAVPRQARQTAPRWAVMPNGTARVLGQMLIGRFTRNRMFGADDLPEGDIRSVVDDFIAEARRAKAMRNDRLARLDAATAVGGGESMFAEDLRHYTLFERQVLEGDPTCLWRYV